jgi:response regulator RpfG family c-di-GMP phosphodiesterase
MNPTPPRGDRPPKKLCLLVVDDEPEVGLSVVNLLRYKYRVLRATGAAEAVDLMAQHDVHLVLTDQRMPNVTGVEMLQRIKSQHPEAIRMLFTGYSDIESVIAAINQGHVYRYLCKPWLPEELEEAVGEAAAEYQRLVEQIEVNGHARQRISELETELAEIRSRVAELEEENRRLRESSAGDLPGPA